MKCAKKDCQEPASRQAHLSFGAIGHPRAPRAIATIQGLVLCSKHCQDVKIDDVFTEENWQKIEDAFREKGLAQPDRKSARLEYEVLH